VFPLISSRGTRDTFDTFDTFITFITFENYAKLKIMKKRFLLRIFFIFLIPFYISITKSKNVTAQGSISCYVLRGTLRDECKTLTRECESGFVPPPGECEVYQASECPMTLNCISVSASPTVRPTSPPHPPSCNKTGDRCCGSIPPLYCLGGLVPSDPNDTLTCTCLAPTPTPGPGPGTKLDPTCETIPGSGKKDGIKTALGCIPVGEFTDFVAWLLRRLIAIAGGIAFLLVIFGGFKILTSAGNPKGIQAGNEMITSALIGLLFIIFSVFLLELIGVKILSIPGL